MIRRKKLIAVVAALFALQAPLCVFACLPSSSPSAMHDMAHDEPPCHDSAPADPVDSHDECGCEDSYTALPKTLESGTSTGVDLVALPVAPAENPRDSSVPKPPSVRLNEADLPPPDILLLNSTLLI